MSLKNHGDNPQTPSLSFLNDLFEVLIDYIITSIDQTTMIVVFWLIVALIIIVAINLYLKIIRQTSQINIRNDQHKTTIDRDQTNVQPVDDFQVHKQTSNDFRENPSVTGTTEQQCITWINQVIQWFYESASSNELFVNEITKNWLNALNTKSKKLVIENGIYVEFVSLEQSTIPKLSQMNVAEEINENMITTMKTTCDRLVMQVRVAPDSFADVNRSAIYDVILEKFSSLLKVVCITNESLFVIRTLERPETKAQIDGPILGSKNKFIPDVIINAVLNVFTSTIFDINFGKFHDFPKIGFDTPGNKETHNLKKSDIERKLLLKIVKAYDLDLNQSEDHQLYCTVEIDEPCQSMKTSLVRENTKSPVWDQHFMFNLNERSNEILFELFDVQKGNKNRNDCSIDDRILGNVIVNISELISSPSQVKNLRLQTGLNKKDFGYLKVEFLLMEHNLISSTASAPSLSQNQEKITSKSSNFVDNQNSIQDYKSRWSTSSELTASSLDDYCDEERNYSSIDFETWERISKSSSFLTTLEKDIPNIELMLLTNTNDNQQVPLANSKSNQTKHQDEPFLIQEENGHALGSLDDQSIQSVNEVVKRSSLSKRLSDSATGSRPRESKSLLRNIKKRFSFNKRSKSVDRQIGNRSSISNYNDSEVEFERARSVPGSREPSMPKETINNESRIKESFGNLSQASMRTFLHEDSILIMECLEKGIAKHYVVPNDSAKKDKFRRKGNKLHLYKDHLFVARHIPSSRLCQICCKKFSLRIGKQAYQCRDCGLHCHKLCHVNVETRCFSSSIASLNLELINSDEHIDENKKLTLNNNTIPELKVTNVEV